MPVDSHRASQLDDDLPEGSGSRRALARPATGELVAEHLRRQIFDGSLRPGDRIITERVAAELSVSRLPVREALLAMARDGLVEVRPHQGAYVGDFDEEVIGHHFEIVGMVQGLAAARLAQHGDPEVLARLAALVERLERSATAGEAYDLVMAFHRIINVEGGSSRQRSVLRALGRMLPTGFFAEVPGAAESGRSGAVRILEAIRTGDTAAIRAACAEVQRERAELVVAHLRAAGVLPDRGAEVRAR